MEAYKYRTRVSEKGLINLPLNPELYNKEVEIIILINRDSEKNKANPNEFLDKWAGFLSDEDTDQAKYDYLSEKYK